MMVNWYDAIAFCNKLSIREGLTPAYSVSVGGTPIDWETLTYADIPTADNADWNAATCNWSSDGYCLPTSSEWCCDTSWGNVLISDPTGPLSDYTGKALGYQWTIHGDCWATAESSLGDIIHLTDDTAHQHPPHQRVNTIGFRVIRP